MQETNNPEDLWRRLDWNDVRTFLAVAQTGSLNAAARALGMTQPTISRRMEDLELRLGARLFQRSSRGVSLTDAGTIVHELAASMARIGDSIVRDVSGRDRERSGRVRLAAPDGIASFVLVPEISSFQMANPEIDLTLDCGLWPDVLIDGEADLSLDYTETPPGGSVSMPVATMHYALFASRAYLNVYGAPKSFAEAAEHRWVRHSAKKEQSGTWHPKATAMGELAGQQLICNSSAATFQAIIHGAGIGALPTVAASIAPDLVMIDVAPVAHPILYLRHPAAATKQSRIQRVKDWIISLFDTAEQPWYRDDFVHPRDFDKVVRTVPRVAPSVANRA